MPKNKIMYVAIKMMPPITPNSSTKIANIKSFTFVNNKAAYLDGSNLVMNYKLKPNDLVRIFSNELLEYESILIEGEIKIGDEIVNDVDPRKRDVSMVFQNYSLFPHMTVRNNIAYPLKMKKIPSSEHDKLIKEVSSLVELQDLLHRKPAELSGGQRQRVALARAIVRQPRVFLMDEPLSNLDAILRVTTRAELKNLHHRLGVTTIYVTHDQVEAMTLGDRLMVLNAGRVEQFDTPIALYERPASMFVAGFIGSPAMNFLPATIENGALTLENKTVLQSTTVAAGAVIIGIRPEHLVQRPDGPLAVRIEMLEHLGANTLVHGVLEGTKTPIVVSIDGLQTLPTNAILCFAFSGSSKFILLT